MPETMEQSTPTDSAPSFNMESAADRIGSALFESRESDTSAPAQPEDASVAPSQAADASTPALPDPIMVPQSWPKEMHDHWGKTPREVQEYWQTREQQMKDGVAKIQPDAEYARKFREAISPYRQTLQTLGIDELRAVQELFEADRLLRYSPADQKKQYFEHLAKTYGIEMGSASAQPETPIDPALKAVREEVSALRHTLTSQQQAALQEAHAKTSKEVEAFAQDAAHPHFNECADDIVALVKAGHDLASAYEKAVWANPATRAKELTRLQQEALEKEKETARLNALPKKQAASANIRSRDSSGTPKEPLGTMEDTMRKTLASIKGRVA